MLVKENHKTLLRRIESVFNAPSLYEAEFDKAQETTCGHGRVEMRTLACTFDLPRRFTGFAGVRQVIRAGVPIGAEGRPQKKRQAKPRGGVRHDQPSSFGSRR